jgi:hypothetical protein
MRLQSIKSVKDNAAKSINRSILKKSRHLGFGVFIVHSSMGGVERVCLSGSRMPPLHSVCSCKLSTKIIYRKPYVANVSVQVHNSSKTNKPIDN